jgi:hypothetical protein
MQNANRIQASSRQPRGSSSAARQQAAAQQIAVCSLQSALALLPHCHASFICCWPGAYWQYCHLENIGNIVIQKTLAILSFSFKS